MPITPIEKPIYAGFIIDSAHEAHAALAQDRERQGNPTRFTGFDGRLYTTVTDEGTDKFVELDWRTPDPKDKSGRWGKYMFLADPKRKK